MDSQLSVLLSIETSIIRSALERMAAKVPKRNAFNDAVFLCQELGVPLEHVHAIRVVIREWRREDI